MSAADEKVVAKIVSYCGIALRNRDSSLVAFSDSAETDRVREKYLKKKLALTQDDATLDAGIAAVGERMKADRTKNRVTVYYLLAEHFDRLDIFGGTKQGLPNAAAAAAATTGTLGSEAVASAPPATSTSTSSAATEPLSARGSSDGHGAPSRSGSGGARNDDGYLGWGCGVALLLLGAIIVAALLAKWADRPAAAPAPAVVAVAPAPAAAPTPAPQAAPDGAGVVAGERDARPMLTVYFDTGRADVTPDFNAAAAPVLAYLAANSGASLAISGFNDPTGNAAANAELSKTRAQNVKAALEALGVAANRARLEKPEETVTTGMSNSEARRVEVVVTGR